MQCDGRLVISSASTTVGMGCRRDATKDEDVRDVEDDRHVCRCGVEVTTALMGGRATTRVVGVSGGVGGDGGDGGMGL